MSALSKGSCPRKKLAGGVQPAFQNPHPVYEQTLRFVFIYDLTENLILYLNLIPCFIRPAL